MVFVLQNIIYWHTSSFYDLNKIQLVDITQVEIYMMTRVLIAVFLSVKCFVGASVLMWCKLGAVQRVNNRNNI